MLKKFLISTILSLWCLPTLAQNIKLVVPFAAGGVADRVARLLEKTLMSRVPYTIQIEYRTGAGGIIASNSVAKHTGRDTVLLLHSASIATNSFNPNSSYDLLQDFLPVAKLGSVPYVLVANQQRGINYVRDIRTLPAPTFYAAGGPGSANHVAGELLAQTLNKELLPVWYKGESPAFSDVLNNTVPMMFVSTSVVAGYVQSTQIVFLAITGTQRNTELPSVPTFAEQGIRGLERSTNWLVLLANSTADQNIIKQIQNAIAESFVDLQIQEIYRRAGVEPDSAPIGRVKEFLSEEINKIRPFRSRLEK